MTRDPAGLTRAGVPGTVGGMIITETEWEFSGELVRKTREALKGRDGRAMSQMAVAAAAGLSLNTVGMVERGELDPKSSTVAALAAALGAEPTDFFLRSTR